MNVRWTGVLIGARYGVHFRHNDVAKIGLIDRAELGFRHMEMKRREIAVDTVHHHHLRSYLPETTQVVYYPRLL
jgi:hypothetical protein